jgi:hypothetical protein
MRSYIDEDAPGVWNRNLRRPSGQPSQPDDDTRLATFTEPHNFVYSPGMLMGKRTVVVLPAYRAEKTVEATFRELPHDVVDAVLLVDDASPDGTVEAARRLGIKTYLHQENLGYGANQKTCYREAVAAGADITVMVHPTINMILDWSPLWQPWSRLEFMTWFLAPGFLAARRDRAACPCTSTFRTALLRRSRI